MSSFSCVSWTSDDSHCTDVKLQLSIILVAAVVPKMCIYENSDTPSQPFGCRKLIHLGQYIVADPAGRVSQDAG